MKQRTSFKALAVLLLALAFSGSGLFAELRLYLANRHDDTLMRFDLNEASGDLT